MIPQAQKAIKLNKNSFKVERKTITTMPADAVIIAKWIHNRKSK